MKFLKIILIIFISLATPVKADSKKNIIENLKVGGKLIFIRHAYAPGGATLKILIFMTAQLKEILAKVAEYSRKKLVIFSQKTRLKLKMYILVNGADVKKLPH